MKPLNVVQQWFSAVVTHPNGVNEGIESDDAQFLVPISRNELERMVTRSQRMSARDRLSIYAHAYYARLIECLGESFPVLKRILGEEVFNGFAFGYLQRYPSRSYTLGRLGENFAKYLDETRPDRNESVADDEDRLAGWPDFLVDLATLEWSIEQVFDGLGIEGQPTLDPGEFLEISSKRWEDIRLRPVPCLRLLRLRFPVLGYYTAIRSSAEEVQVDPPRPSDSFVAVTRRDWVVRLHDLSAPQYELLSCLIRGEPLGQAIGWAFDACESGEGISTDDLRKWFAEWARLRFFKNIELSLEKPE